MLEVYRSTQRIYVFRVTIIFFRYPLLRIALGKKGIRFHFGTASLLLLRYDGNDCLSTVKICEKHRAKLAITVAATTSEVEFGIFPLCKRNSNTSFC